MWINVIFLHSSIFCHISPCFHGLMGQGRMQADAHGA